MPINIPVSKMCKVLGISRSSYYTYQETTPQQDILCEKIVEIFYTSKQIYGTRKIKIELQKLGYIVSRRKISIFYWIYITEKS